MPPAARITKITCLGAVFALSLLSGPAPATPPGHACAAVIHLNVVHDRVTLFAQEASLRELLQRLGRAAGFTTVFADAFTDRHVSWALRDVPVPRTLRYLTRHLGTLIVSRPVAGQARISRVYVYGVHTGAQPAAIDRLEGLAGQEVIDALATILHGAPHASVRSRAARALADIDGTTAIEELEAGLGDEAPTVRVSVIHALGRIGTERALRAVGQVLFNDPDPEARRAAVYALAAHAAHSPAVHAFLHTALKDRADSVQEAARALLRR